MWNTALLGFDCLACSARVEPDDAGRHPVCPSCGQPLVAIYDTDAIGTRVRRDALDRFGHDLWRYRFALPFSDAVESVRLGEGGAVFTPPNRPVPVPPSGDPFALQQLKGRLRDALLRTSADPKAAKVPRAALEQARKDINRMLG